MRARVLILVVALAATTLVLVSSEVDAVTACRGRVPTLVGTGAADVLIGTRGNDVISGLGGDDTISGGGGRDLICGDSGNDRLSGGAGRDVIDGGEGDDRLIGGTGDDRLIGGTGDDRLIGGGGDDRLIGGTGDDRLRGRRAADVLFGGPGRDRLLGEAGNDSLTGGAGRDLADGGPGLNSCDGERSLHCGITTAPLCHPDYPERCWVFRPDVLDVPLAVTETDGVHRRSALVTSGVPIPREVGLTDLSRVRLLDAEGAAVPVQFTVLARWGAGPDDESARVRWLLLDFQTPLQAGRSAVFRLVDGDGPEPALPNLTVSEHSTGVVIDTGPLRATLDSGDGRVSLNGLSDPIVLQATSQDGTVYEAAGPVDIRVTAAGPLRASVRVTGSLRDGSGQALLDYTARYSFHADLPGMHLILTVENNTPCPLVESGQIACFDIGSAGSVRFDDISLVVPSLADTYSFDGQAKVFSGILAGDLLLYQDSSGTQWWNHYPTLGEMHGSTLDTRPRMQAYVDFRGYRATIDGSLLDSGDHAPGVLGVGGDAGAWTVRVPDFWESFPKALRASSDGLEIGLFPAEFGPAGYAFTLRAGEHITHEVLIARGGDPGSPLLATAPAAWYAGTDAAGVLALPGDDWPEYEDYVAAQLDAAPGYSAWMDWYPDLLTAIERTDFYGIFDYGDWPIDYEAYGVAPLNPKYDGNAGAWLQWLRGGDPRWFTLADAANRHLADVDVLHTLHSPRHWSDGIVFGHSYHDEEGFLNPHRNYGGSHPDTMFGVEGLLLTYYLTGYDKAYESAMEIADSIEYRLRNDGRLCGYFPDCSGEGYGLAGNIHDDGERPAANALKIAVDAYRATGDQRYLDVADAVVDWSAAADQPYIDGLPSGDGYLKPWMLALYLRALNGYIEVTGEFGLSTDDAEASYLAYAEFLRDYALIGLDPIPDGPTAAMPYLWSFDGGGNDDPSINNWLLLQADVFAYAHHLSGDGSYLTWAERLFRAGSHDPWFEGDANTYSATKEMVNTLTFGQVFLTEWEGR